MEVNMYMRVGDEHNFAYAGTDAEGRHVFLYGDMSLSIADSSLNGKSIMRKNQSVQLKRNTVNQYTVIGR